MKKEKIVTAGAPTRMDDHVHPFAQGWKVGDFVFTGGIAAEDPETGAMVEGDIRDQARRCMETMKAILEAAGSSMENVVKVTVLFANFDDKKRFEEVYGEYFPGRQAGADVGGGELPRAQHPDGDRRDRPRLIGRRTKPRLETRPDCA